MPEENWLQNSDVLTLFPTLMWKIQLLPEFAETQNLKIISALKKINPDVTDFEETASWLWIGVQNCPDLRGDWR